MNPKRYEENPFLIDMVIPIKSKQVRLSKIGRDDNILINSGTGEVLGTHLTTYKRVDGEQFIKLFTTNIGLVFDLNAAGIKALTVLIWAVQNYGLAKDSVDLDMLTLENFLKNEHDKKLSHSTFKRGLSELENAKIIAKTLRKGKYFINPNFIFNGDRIAFTTVIERVNHQPKTDTKTMPLFTDD